MTEPTLAPIDPGEGSRTPATLPAAPTNGHALTNGHAGTNGHARTNGHTNGKTGTFGLGETAGVLPGDQRTFDDVEAGIVALWSRFGERREQPLRDRLVL